MLLDEGLDTGDVLDVARLSIGPDETAGALSERLAALGAERVKARLGAFVRGELGRTPQDHALATHAPMLEKKDGMVDWSAPAARVHDLVRGVSPWPGAFSLLRGKTVKLHATRAVGLVQAGLPAAPPGTVLLADKSRVAVACGPDGGDTIEFVTVQLEGKRPVSAGEWVCGRGVREGDVFGAKPGSTTK
jgi:methionyl-tRNA formyltransferase